MTDGSTVVVTDDDGVVLGRVYASDLERVDPATTARLVMDPAPSTFRPDVPVEEMARFLDEHELRTALVTTPEGVLLGLLRRERLEASRAT
jgi:Mg/Co/Ni transporter MgtE